MQNYSHNQSILGGADLRKKVVRELDAAARQVWPGRKLWWVIRLTGPFLQDHSRPEDLLDLTWIYPAASTGTLIGQAKGASGFFDV